MIENPCLHPPHFVYQVKRCHLTQIPLGLILEKTKENNRVITSDIDLPLLKPGKRKKRRRRRSHESTETETETIILLYPCKFSFLKDQTNVTQKIEMNKTLDLSFFFSHFPQLTSNKSAWLDTYSFHQITEIYLLLFSFLTFPLLGFLANQTGPKNT